MNTHPPPGDSSPPSSGRPRPQAGGAARPGARRPRVPIVWQAVFGLGALVLLWPLTSLTGVADLIGAPARALGVVAIIGAAWVGVVGLGGVRRPILTLVLTGMVGGGYLVAVDLFVGVGIGDASVPVAGVILVELIGGGALWGALAGLVAAGVQKLRVGGLR